MQAIRFIHAADLHLDTAFSGLSREAPVALTTRLKDATFAAFRRLLELCERERPDFLLLSGDIYNQEDKSLPAQLAVHDGCVRLGELGIPVFIVHGNHDPLSSRLQTLRWPDNVTLFGEQIEAIPLFRNAGSRVSRQSVAPEAVPLAVVHGASHATSRETRNLAARFNRTQGGTVTEKGLHIGVLHATPSNLGTSAGTSDSGPRYAPFALEDLTASGMDYWALGHIHDRREICRNPLALYPGCTQGLHINEPGEKGCLLVTAQPEDDGTYTLSTDFRPLGPVVWLTLDVPLDDTDATSGSLSDNADGATEDAELSLDALDARLRTALDTASDTLWPGCEALIVRVRLTGRTGLDTLLRRGSTAAELVERLRDANIGDPLGASIWIKDMDVLTRPRLDRATLLEREDLLGEILRLAEAFRENPEGLTALQDSALSKLFGDSRARKALEPLTEIELARLLDDAESLCMDLLEND